MALTDSDLVGEPVDPVLNVAIPFPGTSIGSPQSSAVEGQKIFPSVYTGCSRLEISDHGKIEVSHHFPNGPLLPLAVLILAALCVAPDSYAQSGLRESLERLDKNKNGMIEPDEITPLSRPYFEQLSRSGGRGSRFSLEQANKISTIQEVARRFFASKNGASEERIRPKMETTVLPFGPQQDEPQVPEFGLREVKFPYTQDDLDFADRTLRSHDENKDGFIDREEAAEHEWTHRNPFDDDMDKDDRLSRLEMAQRYARRRLLEESSREFRRKNWRTGGYRSKSESSTARRDDSQWWRSGGSDYWLTASLLGRFDTNKNSRLERDEIKGLGISLDRIDVDRDGNVSREELFAYVKEQQNRAGGSAESPPEWFVEKDTNRDGQVSMPEFTNEWSDEKLMEFSSYDFNEDGLLTASEVTTGRPSSAGVYRNSAAELLAPGKTAVSEIEVDEDIVIADVNVQLTITHTNVSSLDAYLTAPNGDRIELFTSIGGSGDHFDQTVFDDQAQEQVVKVKPPYRGTYQPEGLIKGEAGLALYNGRSAKGTWQLTVRGARSDRFGLINSWALMIEAK